MAGAEPDFEMIEEDVPESNQRYDLNTYT